jgi:hypothetical protein
MMSWFFYESEHSSSCQWCILSINLSIFVHANDVFAIHLSILVHASDAIAICLSKLVHANDVIAIYILDLSMVIVMRTLRPVTYLHRWLKMIGDICLLFMQLLLSLLCMHYFLVRLEWFRMHGLRLIMPQWVLWMRNDKRTWIKFIIVMMWSV